MSPALSSGEGRSPPTWRDLWPAFSGAARLACCVLIVLAVNCGSSSLKHLLAQVDPDGHIQERLAEGKLEGAPSRHPIHKLLDQLRADGRLQRVEAVGHRVVHGGRRLTDPVRVDASVLAELDRLSELAPLHNPPAVAGIREVLSALPGIPQVAVFDTAFHSAMPATGARYAVPEEWERRFEVRRYGFHGLAHRWLAERYAEISGRELRSLRLVTLQLGSGCSAAAIVGGRSVDTSMGMTPTEGLVMATRSGDADPTLVAVVSRLSGRPAEAIADDLNHRSGLTGLSGATGDMRELLERAERGDSRAAEAVEIFAYRARKYVGAYLAVLGGADAIVVGGGIGEASPQVRSRILGGLDWLGVVLDPARNQALRKGEGAIGAVASKIAVHVIPDDEQALICRDTAAVASR
jgi:acetate kinase